MNPPLKLLIDACVPGAVVRRLREEGHDVVAVAEQPPDPGDAAILAMARDQGRIIVTCDADFGTLVFRDRASRVGVLRLKPRQAAAQADRVADLVDRYATDLVSGAFVTDDGDRERVNRG